MSIKNSQRTFYVEGRIGLCIGVQITAKSLEEAFEKSKQLTLDDFVEMKGDHNDSNFSLSGVYEATGAPK